MRYLFFLTFLLLLRLPASSQSLPVKVGKHAFTIQYLSFDKNSKPGKVMIRSVGKDEFSIEGEQKNNATDEYVTIKGTFLNKGRELKFNGTIVSKISYVNNGQPCERNGLVVFKASGKRKYWRLQQMLDCDGITTDYIDIYF